ncbi:MAG TPA: NAD-dependent epimerase/dehydratase family protein [Ktedonobacterales bacterium]|nr:NAD-dependent epimerase/dehydratase family protein [Ktedonobacterales bacterium]
MRQYHNILVTGGAGFVGSNLALWLKRQYPEATVIAMDNLKRRGSEATLPRLRHGGVEFQHGDVRNAEDLRLDQRRIDLIMECSAEPSVLAGYGEAPDYLLNTNLIGTINCMDLARRTGADVVFLSTSRVYPIVALNALKLHEEPTRFALDAEQNFPGASERGISERFPLEGARSMYGATKLCSELLIQEYSAMYGVRAIINRCGVLTGPWQMGKVDQGVFTLWVAMHYFERELSYIGWGGGGKQVRDLLHIDDLADLLALQLARFDDLHGQTYNVGGGVASSLSLLETTLLCQQITGKTIPVHVVDSNRPADLALYITDSSRISAATGWRPRRTPEQTLRSIYEWIVAEEASVRHIWA